MTQVRIICREQIDGGDYVWVVAPGWGGETARRVPMASLPADLRDRVIWGVVKLVEAISAEATVSGDAHPPHDLTLQFAGPR